MMVQQTQAARMTKSLKSMLDEIQDVTLLNSPMQHARLFNPFHMQTGSLETFFIFSFGGIADPKTFNAFKLGRRISFYLQLRCVLSTKKVTSSH